MINIDVERNKNFSEQGLALLSGFYSGEASPQLAIARAANCFSFGDKGLAQRIYDAASKQWFFFSSPIFSNAVEGEWETNTWYKDAFQAAKDCEAKVKPSSYWMGDRPKAMPIACFLTQVPDTIDGQIENSKELSLLSVMGGGTAVHSKIRAVSDKAPGPIPYIKHLDGVMGYYRQGKTRRGATAVYMDDSHPDVREFIRMRNPSGGDSARMIDNRKGVHLAVNISSEFIDALDKAEKWELKCPHTGEVRETVEARELWEEILETRALTGEPYLYFIDVAKEAFPEYQKELGLTTHGSNLCSEITLATSDERTAVCCLSSLNLEKYDEWKDTTLVADLTRFLDNVLQWFIDFAPKDLKNAIMSAKAERAIGIGAMGWSNWLMKNNIPFESGGFNSAASWNHRIFSQIKQQAVEESEKLAKERGEPSDCKGTGRRNSHLLAIAPNANSSILCNTTPGIEPIHSNAYPQKTRAGIHLIKNKYLVPVLEAYGKNNDETWNSIVKNQGSVQHLDFLTDHEKAVFKTFKEINQMWVVEHAGERQQYICQSQSVNLNFPPGSDRAYVNAVHLKAARDRKVKSLYYLITGSEAVADNVKAVQRKALEDFKAGDSACLSCEG